MKKTKKAINYIASPLNQIKLFIQFCGIVLIASYIMYAGYKTAEFIDNPVKQYSVAEITIPEKIVDTTIYTANMTVQEKIKFYATVFGVDKQDSLRIAQCESNFNPLAENPNGSATGVFQFIRKTWKNSCSGDVKNADHNIICFMQLYPKHPEYWECK